ncbi:cation transporter dimerization domain-containing protein [Methanobacterium sp. MBAC-LM]|uniref:cation transporter dimerization domain-containing protein n=1 Tax=Methanobacterium sp. MBAC-LM TaxID=3412034 RepID=UPI003C72C9A0
MSHFQNRRKRSFLGHKIKDFVGRRFWRPENQIIDDTKKAALVLECVKGVPNVKVNNRDPYVSAELHIELNKDLKLEKSHKIAHEVEQSVINNVESVQMVRVHTCPTEVMCKKK